MKTYAVHVPGFAPFTVEAVPSLVRAVAALTLELDELPADAIVVAVL